MPASDGRLRRAPAASHGYAVRTFAPSSGFEFVTAEGRFSKTPVRQRFATRRDVENSSCECVCSADGIDAWPCSDASCRGTRRARQSRIRDPAVLQGSNSKAPRRYCRNAGFPRGIGCRAKFGPIPVPVFPLACGPDTIGREQAKRAAAVCSGFLVGDMWPILRKGICVIIAPGDGGCGLWDAAKGWGWQPRLRCNAALACQLCQP